MGVGILVDKGKTYQIVFMGEFNEAEGQGLESQAYVQGFGWSGTTKRELADGDIVAVLGVLPEDEEPGEDKA